MNDLHFRFFGFIITYFPYFVNGAFLIFIFFYGRSNPPPRSARHLLSKGGSRSRSGGYESPLYKEGVAARIAVTGDCFKSETEKKQSDAIALKGGRYAILSLRSFPKKAEGIKPVYTPQAFRRQTIHRSFVLLSR